MLTLTLMALLHAAPDRYLGGEKPTPLAVPGPVDSSPSLQACSTQTLRRSSKCLFDGRPAVVESDAARKKQAKDNVDLARSVGGGLCTERLAPSVEEAKEKNRRMTACLEGTQRASVACSLEGAEVLLDAEGRFSTQARACYEALAGALQSADVPLPPKESPAPNVRPTP
jgi:hypothetical protein